MNNDDNHNNSNEQSVKKKVGFAAMSPEKQREIASRGGKAVAASENRHSYTSETAREAGKKGGKVAASKPGFMAMIGRLGGKANQGKKKRSVVKKEENEKQEMPANLDLFALSSIF